MVKIVLFEEVLHNVEDTLYPHYSVALNNKVISKKKKGKLSRETVGVAKGLSKWTLECQNF
jgi:hypothetical protein